MTTHRIDSTAAAIATALAVSLAVAVGPAPAHGQASADDEKKASEHFSKGAELFLQEKYERAIVEFQQAYQYQPDPMILYNQAVPHARIGNWKKAIEVAERAAEGDLPERPTTKNGAHIAGWSTVLRARRSADALADERSSPSNADLEDPAPTHDPAEVPEAARRKRPTGWGWGGIALGTIGLGGIGYGLYVDTALSDEIRDYRQAARRGDGEAYRSHQRTIDDLQQRGRIALYAGISSAALGGLIWTIDLLNRPSSSDAAVSVSGTGRPGGLGLSVTF